MNKTVELLNSAFKEDPNAIHALLCNRVPCNTELADNKYIPVHRVNVLDRDNFQVGALGLINGILEVNGLPKVGIMFSTERDAENRSKLLGFCE